jgi:hypothetical protein
MATAPTASLYNKTKNWTTIAVLLVAPVLGILGYGVWMLNTPTPRIRTPIPVTRNSLLPHRFAGVCENCHHVQEIGPVEMNAENMSLFNLSLEQRRLLLAGQSVQAPSILQRLRVPAISRVDTLPHPYVGVCSNCHIVLNVTPTREHAQRSMMRAYQSVGLGVAEPERVAMGGVRDRSEREFWRNFFGFVALGLFVLSCVYVGMRFLMQTYPHLFVGKFRIKPWFITHIWCSTAFTVAAILHWYLSDRGNMFLHIALVIAVWLTLAGFVLRYRLAEKETNKNLRLLHTQRWLFVAFVALLIIGHVFAEFY